MTNKEIARTFQFLGNIMELHDENKFKIRSYQNAYISLRKLDRPLAEMSDEEIGKIKGVGKAIVGKIRELLDGGQMATLERYKSETPAGIQEMLGIKGFGPKKIKAVWKDLGVQSIGELLYAVNENRLIELNGFGKKTQEDLKHKLEYFQRSKNKYHYASLEGPAEELLKQLQSQLPGVEISLTGAIRRRANEVSRIEILVGQSDLTAEQLGEVLEELASAKNGFSAKTKDGQAVSIYTCEPAAFGSKLFRYSASADFLQAFVEASPGLDFSGLPSEDAVFSKANLPFIVPELREQAWALDLARAQQLPTLVELSDLKGVLHNHSTYSDGLHSLREMATYTKEQAYEYLGMSDHSKSAFYANGLQVERVYQQMEEIDQLNEELAPFRIFKSIESDILNDGSLDYEEDVLKAFDFIIASVHTNLRMDEAKATQRLITAIENPFTRILGHPTGRLLLSREGYPIDHKKVIDACAENGVAIELNANPYRLDLDWTWIPYALEKGVLISVNPDAHSKEGIHDMHFGVLSARKGGLTAETCLNAKSLSEFEKWLKNGR
ncbi:MAG: DNA polymerase/3'-5' exonuclease PolX [Saprospiraceae bacterium]|nr:DNA polymerase/3'-5' exonuclease PolX [Saprospiraceae bacterium]